jgi:uncharacterized integral membrane protein (TIGR00698 family)
LKNLGKYAPILLGVLACLAIAFPAWFLGSCLPIVGAPIFGILIGIIIGNAYPKAPSRLSVGVKFTSKKVLQLAIILLGFGINFYLVFQVGSQSLFVMVFTLSTAFLTAYLVGKALKLNGKTTMLIGVGTSICGASAIASTAPIINAEDSDMTQAISTIFLFNIIAVFIFPALGHLLGMNDIGFGMWAGTAINDTSSVVAAAASWSPAALSLATIVKLTRTLMIVPIALILSVVVSKSNTAVSERSSFNIVKVFPWFIVGFIVAAVINTFACMPTVASGLLTQAGTFLIVTAMVAIGLNTNIKKLRSNGYKPILLGLCCWFAVAAVSLAVQITMNIW